MLCFLCFVLLESSGGYAKTPNAFIFSLNNYETLAPFLSKVKPEYTGKAIDDSSYYGPKFGADLILRLVLLCSSFSEWQVRNPEGTWSKNLSAIGFRSSPKKYFPRFVFYNHFFV